MYELKKNGKIFTRKSVGTGPSSYEKGIYRAAVSQRLRSTDLSRPATRKCPSRWRGEPVLGRTATGVSSERIVNVGLQEE